MKLRYRDIVRNYYRQGLKLAAGVTVFTFIFLLALELILRTIAFIYDQKPSVQTGKYAILTLGESTTATNYQQKDWPRQLESMLNAENMPTVVYNEGKFATTTSAILLKTPAYIEKYKPKIVITMMGINDNPLLWPKQFVLTDTATDALTFFKSYKFIKFFIETARFEAVTEEETTVVPRSSLNYKYAMVFTKNLTEASRDSEKYAQLITELNSFLKDKPLENKVQFYKHLAKRLPVSAFNKHVDLKKNLEFVMKALRIGPGPADNTAAFALHLAITVNQKGLCKEIIDFAKRDRSPMDDTFLLRSAVCLEDDPEFVKALFKAAGDHYEFRGSGNASPARTNYLRLAKMIEDTGICWIIMAYPLSPASEAMLAVSELENKNIFLLLNQRNFEEALTQYTFEELFTDKFAVEFGHATSLGNSIIAANIYNFIKELKENHQCGL